MNVGILTKSGIDKLDTRSVMDVEAYRRTCKVTDLVSFPRIYDHMDVIRVMNLNAVVPALKWRVLAGPPFVLTLGYDHAGLARLAGKRGKALAWTVLRKVACRWAAGIVVSAWGLEQRWSIGVRYPEVPLRIIPNGVPLDKFWRADKSGRASSHTEVVTLGRLSPEKNLVTLLFALGRVQEHGVQVRLTMYGEGPERPLLAKIAKELDLRVAMPGLIPYDKVPGALRDADIFCIPSWSEGSPKALWEAMACGMPCVVSTGVPDARQYPCWQHHPGDVGGLTASIEVAIEALGGWNGRGVRASMEKHHDLNRTIADEITFTRLAATKAGYGYGSD